MSETANSNSATTEDPATAVDVQDPLPESDWKFRRLYTYLLTILLLVGIGWVLYGLRDAGSADGLLEMGIRLCWLLLAVVTFYMIAPSAEQLARIIQAASILKTPGSSITRTARAQTRDGARTEVTTRAGRPAGPPPSQGGSGKRPERRDDDNDDYAPRGRR